MLIMHFILISMLGCTQYRTIQPILTVKWFMNWLFKLYYIVV